MYTVASIGTNVNGNSECSEIVLGRIFRTNINVLHASDTVGRLEDVCHSGKFFEGKETQIVFIRSLK